MLYESCEQCLINFEPGQQIEADFKEFGSENFMILVYSISCFIKGCKTKTKVQLGPFGP